MFYMSSCVKWDKLLAFTLLMESYLMGSQYVVRCPALRKLCYCITSCDKAVKRYAVKWPCCTCAQEVPGSIPGPAPRQVIILENSSLPTVMMGKVLWCDIVTHWGSLSCSVAYICLAPDMVIWLVMYVHADRVLDSLG